jgi:hypothetical protein
MIQRQQLQQQRLSRITIITTIITTTITITIIIAKQSVNMKLPRLAPGFFLLGRSTFFQNSSQLIGHLLIGRLLQKYH